MKKQHWFLALLPVLYLNFSIAQDTAKIKIKLPAGFRATVFAQQVGQARHLTVADNGTVYIKLGRLKDGKGIIGLRDADNDGVADVTTSFGDYAGTGMAIKNGYLYASSNKEVYRYKLNAQNELINVNEPEKIVTGLVDQGQHNSKSIALDNAGNIYVNVGAPSNACQAQDRTKGSPGQDPCPILEQAGGIWQFKADKLNQTYSDGIRYATGLRNVVGLDWNRSSNTLFVVQHGRDQLNNLFPEMYNTEQSAELPAEEMFEVKQAGAHFGWPYCYYDGQQKKKILAPEYGGDGKQEGRCAGMEKPVVAFPAHLAPNGLLFYTGSQFPEKYRNGAFIAFHGSWNRAPLPQKGFFVAFVPFKNGRPDGDWEIFADDFAGKQNITTTREAMYRPCGLAQGPDGSLYVSDDAKGFIWKISYNK